MKEISSFLVAAAVGLPPQRSAGSSTAGRTGFVPGEGYERPPDERASMFSIGFTLTMAQASEFSKNSQVWGLMLRGGFRLAARPGGDGVHL